MVIDDNGKGLFSTGLRHGDALHVGDLDPARPGLEVFGITKTKTGRRHSPRGNGLYDARTGKLIWGLLPGADVGRGLSADIDPRHSGEEFWSSSAAAGLLDVHGQRISGAPASANFAVWWDADPLREILDSNWIGKWDWNAGALVRVMTATGATSNNGTKATPSLAADILGDWREEVIWRAADNTSLRIYTTDRGGRESSFDVDARSAISPRGRVAERWLQPAAPSQLLPG
jgi:rhamnogalacturonan endolyase